MKSLDQVEPRIPIDSTHTPGNGSNIFIIAASGSYYLTRSLTGEGGKNGILISTSNVIIDLSGYTMFGVAGSLSGVTDGGSSLTNIAVRNGTIRDWGGSGVDTSHSTNLAVSDLFIASNGTGAVGVGVNVGEASLVRDCVLRDNASDNLKTAGEANVFHCISIASRNGNGFNAGADSVVGECVALSNSSNGKAGILIDTNCLVSKCNADYNSGDGIHANNGGGTLSDCNANNNQGSGIVVSSGYSLANCSAQGNQLFAGFSTASAGISTGAGCTLTHCSSTFNTETYGIIAGVGSVLINCSSTSNTSANSTSYGIYVDSGTVIGCNARSNTNTNGTASSSTGVGMYVGSDSTVKDCTASSNKGDGIQAVQRSRIIDCTADANGNGTNGSGIVTDIRSVVRHCGASDNQKNGIVVLGASTVSENSVNHNGVGGPAAGIDSSGGFGSRIEGNQARDNNGSGIVSGAADVVIRNSVGGSATPYNPNSGPNFGPIQLPSTATNPMANILF